MILRRLCVRYESKTIPRSVDATLKMKERYRSHIFRFASLKSNKTKQKKIPTFLYAFGEITKSIEVSHNIISKIQFSGNTCVSSKVQSVLHAKAILITSIKMPGPAVTLSRSSRSSLTTSSSSKNLKKPTTWEKKLETKYGIAKDDAVAILQIAKFELGIDPKDHASSTQKKEIFKKCRRISAEYGYKDIPTKKKSKSSKKVKTLDDSDDDDIQPPMSESELTETTDGMTESEGSGEDEPTPVPVRKETKTKKTSSGKKTTKNASSLDVELDDGVDDKVEALRRKVEKLESKMDDLLDVNNKMASNLDKILLAVK